MMLQLLILAVIVLAANAYTMAGKRSQLSMTMFEKSPSLPFLPKPKNLDAGLPGYKGFDPAGFSDWIDVRYLQEAEIKHGRIAMLGFLGFVITDLGVKLPGDIHAVSSVAAHDVFVQNGALYQVLVAAHMLEFFSVLAVKEMLEEGSGREPGYFGFDPLNLGGKTDAEKKAMKAKEIENGRAAMIAFSGVVTAAVLSGKGFPYF